MAELYCRRQSHDIYEKTGTYARNVKIVRTSMLLIKSCLSIRKRSGGRIQGELNPRAKATMSLKTKETERADLIKATMLIKTHDLYF